MKKKVIIIASIILGLIAVGTCVYLLLFTDLIIKRMLPTSINTITVSYIPGNDLNCDKEFIKKQEVSFDKDDIKLIKPLLKGVTKQSYKDKIVGKFEVVINKEVHLFINGNSSYIVRNNKKTTTKFNNDLYDVLYYIISEKQDKNYYSTIDFQNIVLKKKGSSIKITNKNNLEILKKHVRYTKIEPSEEDLKTFGDILLEIAIDDKYTISIFNNNLAGIKDISNDGFFFAVVDEKLFDTCETIYSLSLEDDKKEN